MKRAAIVLASLGVVGCTGMVVRPRTAAAGPPPGVAWADVRDVIWLEYYGASWHEIAYARGLGYDDCDLFVLMWASRRAGWPLERTVRVYEAHHHHHEAVFVEAQVEPPDVLTGTDNAAYREAVDRRIGRDYFGFRGSAQPHRADFHASHARAGAGGKRWDEGEVVRAPRPWDSSDGATARDRGPRPSRTGRPHVPPEAGTPQPNPGEPVAAEAGRPKTATAGRSAQGAVERPERRTSEPEPRQPQRSSAEAPRTQRERPEPARERVAEQPSKERPERESKKKDD
jgi:hypothetical protein